MASNLAGLILIFLIWETPLSTCQQTFQNTIFDLPAQLGGEPVGVAAQAQGAPLFVQAPDAKPPPAAPALPQPAAAPAAPAAPAVPTPLPAFTLPTLAPFTFPSHPTVAPFTFPTHPTIAPFTFPTHAPLVFTTPAPIVPPSPYAFVPQAPQPGIQAAGYQQQPYQQYNGYPQQQQYYNQQQQQYYNNYYNGYNNQVQQPQYPQQQVQQPVQQVQQVQQPVQQPVPQPQPAQNLPQVQSFESQSQVVQPVAGHQPVQQVHQSVQPVQPVQPFQPVNAHAQVVTPKAPVVNAVATQQVDTETASKKAAEFNSKQNVEFQPKPAKVEKANLDADVDSNLDRHLWFAADYDVKECRKNLRGMGVRFQKKFPSYLQKGGKDRELAELVEQRLLECERKSSASHWDKVDTLLQKISLTKSEEGECRAGLIQERISCVNLLKYACQFVDSTYHFKLVPARITIQEARQAESGAEKCRQVVRIVKQRLESGAVTL